jgi:hypothetical protein
LNLDQHLLALEDALPSELCEPNDDFSSLVSTQTSNDVQTHQQQQQYQQQNHMYMQQPSQQQYIRQPGPNNVVYNTNKPLINKSVPQNPQTMYRQQVPVQQPPQSNLQQTQIPNRPIQSQSPHLQTTFHHVNNVNINNINIMVQPSNQQQQQGTASATNTTSGVMSTGQAPVQQIVQNIQQGQRTVYSAAYNAQQQQPAQQQTQANRVQLMGRTTSASGAAILNSVQQPPQQNSSLQLALNHPVQSPRMPNTQTPPPPASTTPQPTFNVPRSQNPATSNLVSQPQQQNSMINQQQIPNGIQQSQQQQQPQSQQNQHISTEPEKRKLIQHQLVLLLHAHRCSQRTDQSKPCQVQHCAAMRNVLAHLPTCTEGRACQVLHCVSSRQIMCHWRNCQKTDCLVCKPVRNAVINRPLNNNNPNNANGANIDHLQGQMQQPGVRPPITAQNQASQQPSQIQPPNQQTVDFLSSLLPQDPRVPEVLKDWQTRITMEMRKHLISKIVKTIYPSQDENTYRDARMSNLLAYAYRTENEMFEQAKDQEDYFHLLAERIYKIKRDYEDYRNAII